MMLGCLEMARYTIYRPSYSFWPSKNFIKIIVFI